MRCPTFPCIVLFTALLGACSSTPEVADGAVKDATPDSVAADQAQADKTGPRPDSASKPDLAADQGQDRGVDLAADRGPGLDRPVPDRTPTPDRTAPPDRAVSADAAGLTSRLTKETWYSGSTTCTKKSFTLTGGKGTITVNLNQLPASEVTGTCANHKTSAALSSSTVTVTFTAAGGACWTACWDLEVLISGLAPGSYTVKVLTYTGTVKVS